MTKERLEIVKTEMRRLAAKINELEAAQKINGPPYSSALLPRENGAVRRASMDLTRALADLRKS